MCRVGGDAGGTLFQSRLLAEDARKCQGNFLQAASHWRWLDAKNLTVENCAVLIAERGLRLARRRHFSKNATGRRSSESINDPRLATECWHQDSGNQQPCSGNGGINGFHDPLVHVRKRFRIQATLGWILTQCHRESGNMQQAELLAKLVLSEFVTMPTVCPKHREMAALKPLAKRFLSIWHWAIDGNHAREYLGAFKRNPKRHCSAGTGSTDKNSVGRDVESHGRRIDGGQNRFVGQVNRVGFLLPIIARFKIPDWRLWCNRNEVAHAGVGHDAMNLRRFCSI